MRLRLEFVTSAFIPPIHESQEMPHFKPECYTTVSPYLIVVNAAATIEFLKQAFGAIELRRFDGNDGRHLCKGC